MPEYRWKDCVQHRRDEVPAFVDDYFGRSSGQVLFVGGAGFDPRACTVAELIAKSADDRLRAVFLKEERPEPAPLLRAKADENRQRLAAAVPDHEVVEIHAFATDNAAVVGREAVLAFSGRDLSTFSDIVLDLSALSIGASFPLTRYLLEMSERSGSLNLHLVVAADSGIDDSIRAVSSDIVSPVHGFRGGWGLEENRSAARLWMPQLARGKRAVLNSIERVVDPHDVAPILPFPARQPKLSDELVAHFRSELQNNWDVDSRDLVFAEENNPLDLYAQILSVDARRKPVFSETGGALTILTPTGSKVLAIGAMMAAIEKDLPVLHAENVAYEVDSVGASQTQHGSPELVHVWLHGDTFPMEQ